VFLRHRFSEDIFKKGVKAFRHFKEMMDEFGVTRLSRRGHQRLARSAQPRGLRPAHQTEGRIALE